MRKISILGSTGSIGTQALDIIRSNKDIEVVALAAGSNIELLIQQIKEFKPGIVSVESEALAKDLAHRISDINIDIRYGSKGLIELASLSEIDIVLSAVVGMRGIEANVSAIKAGKTLALANKETIVCAGHIITDLMKRYDAARLYPVDSEHSAIFQCLEPDNKISKILLTASGGPFRGYSKEELKAVTLEQALKHPNWSMGKKITIDSSTMVNKGLEVIEAMHLFDLEVNQIEVLVQPSSTIHSMVEFEDGAIKAQLGTADMRLPIQYALYYPERRYLDGDRIDFKKLGNLKFEDVDMEVFEGLKYAFEAAKLAHSMPTVYNAANEFAVARFLERKISYMDITGLIRLAMDKHRLIKSPSIEEIWEIQRDTEEYLETCI